MAEPKKEKKEKKETKEQKINAGAGKVEKPICPKCGPGTRLAEHADRCHCGKCGYTRWKAKAEAAA